MASPHQSDVTHVSRCLVERGEVACVQPGGTCCSLSAATCAVWPQSRPTAVPPPSSKPATGGVAWWQESTPLCARLSSHFLLKTRWGFIRFNWGVSVAASQLSCVCRGRFLCCRRVLHSRAVRAGELAQTSSAYDNDPTRDAGWKPLPMKRSLVACFTPYQEERRMTFISLKLLAVGLRIGRISFASAKR